jgi:anti-sigma factor RsiW
MEEVICEQVRGRLDAYSSSELSAAMSDETGSHLEHCADCRAAMEEDARVKHYLQRAVRVETAPDALRQKIQNQIRANQPQAVAPFAQITPSFARILCAACAETLGFRRRSASRRSVSRRVGNLFNAASRAKLKRNSRSGEC